MLACGVPSPSTAEIFFLRVQEAVDYVLEGRDQGEVQVGPSIVLAACTAAGQTATQLHQSMRQQLSDYHNISAALPAIALDFESSQHSRGRCKMVSFLVMFSTGNAFGSL
jgi:hypothetical protein